MKKCYVITFKPYRSLFRVSYIPVYNVVDRVYFEMNLCKNQYYLSIYIKIKNFTGFSILHTALPVNVLADLGPFGEHTQRDHHHHSPLTRSPTAAWLSRGHWGASNGITAPKSPPPSSQPFVLTPKEGGLKLLCTAARCFNKAIYMCTSP